MNVEPIECVRAWYRAGGRARIRRRGRRCCVHEVVVPRRLWVAGVALGVRQLRTRPMRRLRVGEGHGRRQGARERVQAVQGAAG